MKTIRNRRELANSKAVGPLLTAAFAVIFTICSDSYGVVVIRDGFGDGDRNNDGIAFQENDAVNGIYGDILGDYEPHFDDGTMMPRGAPPLFPADTMVISPTVAGDTSNDTNGGTGIRWLSTGGITNSGFGDPAAAARIINDAAGQMPETIGNSGFHNAVSGTTQFIPALGDGLALSVEGKGRTRGISAFFETDGDYSNGKQDTVALGPKVNDEVKVSFDFRVWMSAPNFNEEDTTNHVPTRGEIRFGLFNDADDELGMTNSFAGPLFSDAVWGEDDGHFRGDLSGPDASGDPGWFARLQLYDPDVEPHPLFGPFPDGRNARIIQDTNAHPEGVENQIHLQGSSFANGGDTVTVTSPDQLPDLTYDFGTMEITKRYNIEFSLKRIDETGGSTDPAVDGDNVEATVTFTDIDNPSDTHSLTGFNPLDPEMMDPAAGFFSDAWDYFSITTGGSSVSDGLDFVIDNFVVEVTGSNAPMPSTDTEPDGDVDGADFLELQRSNPALIPQWESDFGQNPLAAAGAVPEPTTLASLCLGGLLALGAARRKRA